MQRAKPEEGPTWLYVVASIAWLAAFGIYANAEHIARRGPILFALVFVLVGCFSIGSKREEWGNAIALFAICMLGIWILILLSMAGWLPAPDD